MFHSLRRMCLIGIAGWAIVVPHRLAAQDWNQSSRLYSQGVHAYFAGRTTDAESLLSRAIAIDSHDPRALYFRALCRMRLGYTEDARRDMIAGAALEAQQPKRYAVGKALERVQGSDRLMLERIRRQGHQEATAARLQLARQREQQIAARDEDVSRRRVVLPLDELLRPGGPRPLTAEQLARRAANASPPDAEPDPPATTTAPSQVAAPDNPFRDDPPQPAATMPQQPDDPADSSPATEPVDEDPFSGI